MKNYLKYLANLMIALCVGFFATLTTAAAPESKAKAEALSIANRRSPPANQVFEKASLPDRSDRDEADAVLRRTGALIQHLTDKFKKTNLTAEKSRIAELKAQAAKIDVSDIDARLALLKQACQLRRKAVFANPLLDFDRILFIKRHFLPRGNHMCDQYFGYNAVRGGGVFVLEKPFSDKPTVRNVLENASCVNGRFKGQKISARGGFLSPELSFDARQILFAWTEIAEKRSVLWTENNTYKVFRVNVDGTGLTQLTDGPWNDFDPCFMPNGRIVFISERRGGYGRCHGRPVPSWTLHSMHGDGSDIVCLSPHETNEWQPSMNHDGTILYTRWDYVDRGFNQAHHGWVTTVDGRNPRAIHGNFSPSVGGRPHMEMQLRAVPNSHKIMATASGHHTQTYGSIILIDPSVPDDDAMSPVKRLTPDQNFPESEATNGGKYSTPWPLSEHFFLCVYDPDSSTKAGTKNNYGIYLVDAFGNKELLYRDPQISCLDPIPLKPRPVPPVMATQTAVGKPLSEGGKTTPPDPKSIPDYGTVSLMDVNESLYQMPKDNKISHLRIIQILPKTTPSSKVPNIGYACNTGARMVLGTVPVEEDGSAHFKMPAGKPVYFQALGADGLAVQSMRSATYVHPGENLSCLGCHEPRLRAPSLLQKSRLALKRPPSEIKPDVDGSRPFSYPILVQPVLEKNCVVCHQKSRSEGKKVPDLSKGEPRTGQNYRIYREREQQLRNGVRVAFDTGQFYASYDALRPFAFFWDNHIFDPIPRTTPGKFGARASLLYQMLKKGHNGVKLPPEDLHRITLWLDCNSVFFGSYEDIEKQLDCKVVWPKLE